MTIAVSVEIAHAQRIVCDRGLMYTNNDDFKIMIKSWNLSENFDFLSHDL